MDERVKKIIDFTKEKFGLDHYDLKTYEFYRNVDFFSDTVYTLCMEWFPSHITNQEDDEVNPEGTAVIEFDMNRRKFKRVIFVGGKSYANGVTFFNSNLSNIIKWIEDETGLTYGEQFLLEKEEKGEFYFKGCFNGVDVSPYGSIKIKCDQEGHLIFFSVYDQFPSKEFVNEETYTLSLDRVEHLAKEQLQLITCPSYEQKRLVSVYAIEEIFVTNDQRSTIPFVTVMNERLYLKIDEIMDWDKAIKQPFERKELHLFDDVTAEQAFSCEMHPDLLPITKLEQEKCVMAIKDFMRQEYPNDAGKWVLKTLHRDKGYIHATLRTNQQDNLVFQRKLLIIIDAKTFQAINDFDNKMLLETFDQFDAPKKVMISKEEAFGKLKELFELKPCYVYDFKQKQYVLCGKLDCHYGVNASSGEVIALDDL